MNSIFEKLLGRSLSDQEKHTLAKRVHNYADGGEVGGLLDQLTNAYHKAASQNLLGTAPKIESDPDSSPDKFKGMQDYTNSSDVDVRTPEQKQRAIDAAKQYGYADGGDVLPELNYDPNQVDQSPGANTVLRADNNDESDDSTPEEITDQEDSAEENNREPASVEEDNKNEDEDSSDNEKENDESDEEMPSPDLAQNIAEIAAQEMTKGNQGPSLDFTGQNAGDLRQLLAERRKDLNIAQINKGLAQIGAGLARTTPDASIYDDAVKRANLPIEDYMALQKNESNDPKSGISQGMRDYMSKQLGINVSPNATAAQIGQVAPMVLKQMQAKQAQEAKSADLAARLKEKQMEVTARMAQANALREKTSSSKEAKADTDRLDKMSKAVTAEVASGRSAFGQAARNAQSIQNAQALLNGEVDPNNLDNRQVFELTRTLDRVLSQAGGTVAGSEHLTPDTARSRLSKLMEFVTNKRQGAQAGSFIKTFASTLDREAKQSQKQIFNTQKSMLSSYKDLQNKYPDRFNDILSAHGISPDMLTNTTPDQSAAPSAPPATNPIQITPDMQSQAQAEIERRKKAKGP